MNSIIIVNFNTRELLRYCLLSVEKFEPGSQVIIVDNASRDGSADMVAECFPSVVLIRSSRNIGFAAANNLGIEKATGQYVTLLNSDTELKDNSLNQCVDRLAANPRLGAVHPQLIGQDGCPQKSEHTVPTISDVIRKAFRLKPRGTSPYRWLAGTALVIRREALADAGGKLDDRYFMYWEDADLSARLTAAGWELGTVNETTIRHLGGASGGGPDANRRADLYTWYCWGKHRWFRQNRPLWESTTLWLFDAFDVVRKYLRGVRHANRRASEWSHARVTARVLGLIPTSRRPMVPA